MTPIPHPRKTVVPLAVGLAWGNDGAVYQEKLDGEFATLELPDGILAGEKLRDKFIAWDCVGFHGRDVRGENALDRLEMAAQLGRRHGYSLVRESANGGELLESVLAAGGEGIVRKLPHATYYDGMTACKRLQTWACRIVGFAGGTQSADIADAQSGEKRGRVALRGGKIDRVRIGSIVKIEGLELHESGLIREPRPDKDSLNSWLVKY